MTRAKAALTMLRDVDGSMGSFLVGTENQIVDRDAPSFLDTATLDAVGRRVANALSSSQMQLPGVSEVALLFARGGLVARRCRHGIVVLMGDSTLHTPTARIALAVCARQIDALDVVEPMAPDAATASAAQPAPAPQVFDKPKKQKKEKASIWA